MRYIPASKGGLALMGALADWGSDGGARAQGGSGVYGFTRGHGGAVTGCGRDRRLPGGWRERGATPRCVCVCVRERGLH